MDDARALGTLARLAVAVGGGRGRQRRLPR